MSNIAIIFDMDGVLINSEKLSKEIWIELSHKYDANVDDIKYLFDKCLGMNTHDEYNEFKTRLNWDFNTYRKFTQDVDKIKNKKRRNGALPLKEYVVETLDFLKKRNVPLAVASSSSLTNILNNLNGNNISHYFRDIVSGDDIKHSKPNPEIFQIAQKRLNISKCYVIEDSKNGYLAAKNAGLIPIMINDTVTHNFSDAEIINDLRELKKIFKEI